MAHDTGTSHHIFQRGTAIIMIPLVIWFIYSIISHSGDSHAEFMTWVGQVQTAVPLGLLIIAGFFHMRLGLEIVIDDYITNPDRRSMLQFLNTLVALILGAIALWSVIAISLIV